MQKYRGPEQPGLVFEPSLDKPHPEPKPEANPVKREVRKRRRPEDYDPTDVGVSAPVEKK